MHYDVFNGDADGIIALLQLRLANPKKSRLITGVKRDIQLLKQVDVAKASSVTVLDVSLEKNLSALEHLLAAQVKVFYVDHHKASQIPDSDHLESFIDLDANTCTSLLVNQYLSGQYAHWAIAAAFGDNMINSAVKLATQLGISEAKQAELKQLGVLINYNGYGASVEDLHFHPAELYQTLLHYPDPFELIAETGSIFEQLNLYYQSDIAKAQNSKALINNEVVKVVLLEDGAWSRRISGVWGNELANASPDKAHAVLTLNNKINSEEANSYTVSLRAPLNNKQGAEVICSQFPSGGGRAAAAGINQLPEHLLESFITTMTQYYS